VPNYAVIASEAKQSRAGGEACWHEIASSLRSSQ
jgi:hypothetical protein